MSLLLLIHTYPGGSSALLRHHDPFHLNFKSDRIVHVVTEDGICETPSGFESVAISTDSYMNGPNLPERLMRTLEYSLTAPETWSACIEYDTLAIRADPFGMIPMDTSPHPMVFCDRTGGRTFDSKASFFSHNPWVWNKPAAELLVPEMKGILSEGHCAYGTPESSPDVFWAYASERAGVAIIHGYWGMFSRNSFDVPGDLELAVKAARDGVSVIHGIKTEHQLAAIVGALK